jgi:hypothetical protein
MKTLCDLFIEQLNKCTMSEKEIRDLCHYLKPFLDFLEETYNVTTIGALTRAHISEYTTIVRCHSLRTNDKELSTAAGVNKYISAVRMFCIMMFIAEQQPCSTCGR